MLTIRSWSRFLALLLAFSLFAAACGDDDSDDGDGGDDDTEVDGGEGEGEGEGEGDGEGDGGDGGEGEDAGAMTPQRGGEITALLEAESDTWAIPGANCALSCITVMRTVTDPLTVVNADGEAEPFLLESIESNDDFTEYTMTMREGINFHDGTPADGAALVRHFEEMKAGALQGQVLFDMTGVELVDEMTATITFSAPFSSFPFNIAERTGYLVSPSFWDDENNASALPIGTGPFEMVEWSVDEQTVVEANPDYWRTDANGEALPYLDRITFRPIPDVSTRRATMESGDADVNMDSFAENQEFWETEWVDDGNGLVEADPSREASYLLINNENPPFDNADVRRALALCTDRDEYIAFRSPGSIKADGPFAEGSPGYLADNGFPDFDPVAGNALLDEVGRPDVITYGTTNVPSNLLTAELFQDMWNTNCGLNVVIDQFDQSELITKAITGDFEVFLWRNHGQGNPALEYVWWHSRHATGIALNFGRIVDADMDAALDAMFATDDAAELQAQAETVNEIFGSEVYNLWLSVTDWMNVYRDGVHGVDTVSIPSGNEALKSIAGRVWLSEAWVEG